MVRIRFAEIKGLYSYGNEKNKIDFGEKTLIVGPNNSGKSSIFKAIDFFLKSLTEYTDRESKPWHEQDSHEMTVGFTLNESERRYVAEVLLICKTKGTPSLTLAQNNTVEWLASQLKDVTLTIQWIEDQFSRILYRPRYILKLDELEIFINAEEYNSSAWVTKDSTVLSEPIQDSQSFGNAVEELILQDSPKKELVSLLEQHPLAVTDVPVKGHLNHETLTRDEKHRIQFLIDMSKNHIPPYNKKYPFFVALGYMLQPKFVFVSEQRKFPDSSDLEKTPLKEDGSNIHSFLFWLKNGSMSEQETYAAIQDKFKKVHGKKYMPFLVSVVEKETPTVQKNLEQSGGEILPDRAVISFPGTSGQKQRFVDFAHVGAGIKETLFLLSSCFDRQDKVIFMDEPAANLHPTLIKRLMHEILTPDSQGAKLSQIAVITHSQVLASLEMLSSANKIVRVDRHEYSEIVQPSEKDEEWISKYLATFHLLKPDVLFSRKVILVEGESDKIFVEAILNMCAEHEGSSADYIAVNVGGKSSFKKFQTFLNIFKINFVILADGDAKNKLDSQYTMTLTVDSLSREDDLENKNIYILEKDLEHLLACLDQKIYDECSQTYTKKPERSYYFIKHLLADNSNSANTAIKIARLIGGTNDSDSF